MSLSAELRWSHQRTPNFIAYFHTFLWQTVTNISKSSPQSTQTPIFTVISETEFLQRLFVGKNNQFQFFCFYTMFTGVWRDFWMCLSDLTLQTPKSAKSLQMGPQNTVKQPLRHDKIRCLRACRSYFYPTRSYSKQHLGPNLEGVA